MSKTISIEKKENGVEVSRINQTVEAINQDASKAKFQFRLKNRWINGSHNRSVIQHFYGAGQEDESRKEPFVFDNGEPACLLGKDEGANPVEFLLHALAGCMTTTMVYHAAAQGIKVEEIESELDGHLDLRGFLKLDDAIRKGYRDINVRFYVKSDASIEQLEELAKNSPVYDVVNNPTPVNITVTKK